MCSTGTAMTKWKTTSSAFCAARWGTRAASSTASVTPYTLSDPRAVELKKQARSLAAKTGYADQFALYERIERLAPDAFHKVTGNEKVVCANVDFYSGLVYEMLGIPEDLYTPMFAVSRISGWCAHRIEELTTGGRIIRPAYRALPTGQTYIPLKDRHYDTKSVL